MKKLLAIVLALLTSTAQAADRRAIVISGGIEQIKNTDTLIVGSGIKVASGDLTVSPASGQSMIVAGHVKVADYVDFPNIATPGVAPAAGSLRLYSKPAGFFYTDSSLVEHQVGAVTGASNVGSLGVGPFKTNSGGTLQFKNIAAGDNTISVAALVTDNIGITVNPANLTGIPQSGVTGLVSDLAGKQATGNYLTALTGQVVAAGPGSSAAVIQPGVVTNAMLAGGITSANLVGTDIATVGTITSGTWTGTTIAVANGGSGQTSYTNGQLLIGNTTGNTLTKATLTAGTGITVTNGTGTINLAINQGSSLTWTGTERFNNGIQAQGGIIRATAGQLSLGTDANTTGILIGSAGGSTTILHLDSNGATITGGRVLADNGYGRETAGQGNFCNQGLSTSCQFGGGSSTQSTLFGNNTSVTANNGDVAIDATGNVDIVPSQGPQSAGTHVIRIGNGSARGITLNSYDGVSIISGGGGSVTGGAISITAAGSSGTATLGSTQGTTVSAASGKPIQIGTGSELIGFLGATPIAKPTITGSRGGNAAIASFLTALASEGLIIDSTTP